VLACTHRKQIYHLSKTKQHACGPQNLQASACTPLEAHRLLSGTIIGCIQIMSLNISRHPSTRESKGKARSPTSKVIQDQIRIRPRLHLPAAQLRFARAQPRARDTPAWALDSPKEHPWTNNTYPLTRGHLGRRFSHEPSLGQSSQNRKTCALNAHCTNTCLAEDAKVNKGRWDRGQIYFHRPR
jgi:hypothetical protein